MTTKAKAGGVVQWAWKWPDGTYETHMTRPKKSWFPSLGIVRVSITEIPAKASKRKALKDLSGKRKPNKQT